MGATVHNPDQYMVSLRQIVAQGRKRIGLLVGAGAPAGTFRLETKEPLIPAVEGLTKLVLSKLKANHSGTLDPLCAELKPLTVETLLSRVRSLGQVIGSSKVHGLDGAGYQALGDSICKEISAVVKCELPADSTPYSEIVSWIGGASREHAVEIFTTNYDMLFEQALERARVPYFDGFTGANEPFFDPASVAGNDLPPRWVRLWKLHGSLGWAPNERGEVVRTGQASTSHLVFPEHLKYDQTQKAPYAALFDRLRDFLMEPDTLLLSTGFSFADAHISARLDECLSANPSASVFAFQFKPLDKESHAFDIAKRRPNMSVLCPDKAVMNGISAPWAIGDLPTKDWAPIRATYWGSVEKGASPTFQLGRFDKLARFFASARAPQHTLVDSAAAPPEAKMETSAPKQESLV